MSDSAEPTPNLASLLRCPISTQALRQVPLEECSEFPGEWEEGGYLTEDGQILYPIRKGFPLLVPSEAVRLKSEP